MRKLFAVLIACMFLLSACSSDATVQETTPETAYIPVSGLATNEWSETLVGVVFQVEDGWNEIDGERYFGEDGEILTGWYELSGDWYYLDPDNGGRMTTGEVVVDGETYRMNDDGVMITGWYEADGNWQYYKDSGARAYGWYPVDGVWYYFIKADGTMVTGWLTIGSQRYYLDSSGAMVTGTYAIDGTDYVFDENGLLTG